MSVKTLPSLKSFETSITKHSQKAAYPEIEKIHSRRNHWEQSHPYTTNPYTADEAFYHMFLNKIYAAYKQTPLSEILTTLFNTITIKIPIPTQHDFSKYNVLLYNPQKLDSLSPSDNLIAYGYNLLNWAADLREEYTQFADVNKYLLLSDYEKNILDRFLHSQVRVPLIRWKPTFISSKILEEAIKDKQNHSLKALGFSLNMLNITRILHNIKLINEAITTFIKNFDYYWVKNGKRTFHITHKAMIIRFFQKTKETLHHILINPLLVNFHLEDQAFGKFEDFKKNLRDITSTTDEQEISALTTLDQDREKFYKANSEEKKIGLLTKLTSFFGYI